jgi:choloylglycine hydrolase
MCTALALRGRSCVFGRNLDLEYTYDETVTIVPRHYPLHFRMTQSLPHHYAIIGIAYVQDDYPLYYDAINEKGLAIAGLRFPESTVYRSNATNRTGIAPFELIPWLLGQCASVADARERLSEIDLVKIDFSPALPCTPLHWLIADQTKSIVLESREHGLDIFENLVDVLTNEPPFPQQIDALNRTSDDIPDGYSSAARFRRAVYIKNKMAAAPIETDPIHRFFHLLDSVSIPCGQLVPTHPGMITQYSSCCDMDQCIYYYTTYENRTIQAVELYRDDPDGTKLISYPLLKKGQPHLQNL